MTSENSPSTSSPPSLAEKHALITRLMQEHNLTFADIAGWQGLNDAKEEADLLENARTYHRDGDLEFDDNPVVSRGDDNGAYVMCWKWVYDR